MRALRIHRYGGPEELLLENISFPVPGKGQLLLKVSAASVNPIDWKMRRGMLAGMFPLTFPRTLGRDCAGELDGRLYAGVADMRTDGTHAEFALLPENQCSQVPQGLDAAAAASLCVAGLSAYIPLVEFAALKKDQKILIHAGAGGVGSLALQIARHVGAEVHATASAANRDYCLSLGASPIPQGAQRPDVRVVMAQIQPTRERLEKIFQWAASGILRPQVTRRFGLEEGGTAYTASESGHGRGKI